MRTVPSTLFSLSFLCLAAVGIFAFHRVLEPNRICLAWEGIREFSFQDKTIPECDSVSRLGRPLAEEPLRDWTARLNQLDRLSWLKESSRPVTIRIDTQNPHAFQVENDLVTIGFGLAEKPGQLEHATLLGWVKTNWPQRSETTQEVMADLLTWLVLGDSQWSDPLNDQNVTPSTYIRYSLTPSSMKNYCLSPFRSLQDLDACDSSDTSNIPAAHALRPLVSWTIWSFVKDLASSTQIQFFQSLLKANFEEDPRDPAMHEEVSFNRQLWAKTRVLTLLKHWGLEDQTARHELTRAMNKTDLNAPLAFDLTVEVGDLHLEDRVRESLSKWSAFYPALRILFVANHKKIVFPEGVAVDFSAAELETRHYVMLACGWPKPEDTFSPKNHRFSAYQICGDDKLPSWTEMMTTRPTLAL